MRIEERCVGFFLGAIVVGFRLASCESFGAQRSIISIGREEEQFCVYIYNKYRRQIKESRSAMNLINKYMEKDRLHKTSN